MDCDYIGKLVNLSFKLGCGLRRKKLEEASIAFQQCGKIKNINDLGRYTKDCRLFLVSNLSLPALLCMYWHEVMEYTYVQQIFHALFHQLKQVFIICAIV